jgi:hypothetical protein
MSGFNARKFIQDKGWRKFNECGSCGGGNKVEFKKPSLAGYEITIIIKRDITDFYLTKYGQLKAKGIASEETLTEALQGL